MLRRASVTALSVLALAGAAACSPMGSGGTSGTTEPAPPSQAVDPAFKVDNPKNLKNSSDACQLLKPEQLAQLGASDAKAEPTTNSYGESTCEWNGGAFTTHVSINTKFGGMSRLNASKDKFDNYTPTKVAGYPAARVDAQSGLCAVNTGVADDQSIEVYYAKNSGGTPEMDDACGYAERITTEVLKNVPDA